MKKRRDFLPPNKTKPIFLDLFQERRSRLHGPMKKRKPFSPPNKTKPMAEALCDALNAPQFKAIEIQAPLNAVH